MIRLIRNADDLGLTASVSARVGELLAARHLDDASLLACGEAFEAAAQALHGAGAAQVGLHLCATGGEAPVCDPKLLPTLAPGGRFRAAWPRVALAAAARRISARELEREWTAQAERVLSAGFGLSHLDGHQHLHLLPSFLPVTLALAKRFDVPFVRAPRADDPAAWSTGGAGRLRSRLLARFGAAARAAIVREGLPEPPRVLGLAEAGGMDAARWERLLDRLPRDGTFEAVLHPGTADAATRERYRWGYAWEAEAAALEKLGPALVARGIAPTSFASLTG